MNSSTYFSNLRVENWRQYDIVDIDIHPRLTVLTGANGAGKTTLLNVLTQHFGWSRPLLSTPWRDKNGAISYLAGALQQILAWSKRKEASRTRIGHIRYSNISTASLWVPKSGDIQYSVEIADQQHVAGLLIPSHRTSSTYQQINSISTTGIKAIDAFHSYRSETMSRYNGGHSGFSPIFRMKEALISMATFGEGNKYVKGRPELLNSYLGFIEILRKILPESLGFITIEIRTPDVVLITKSGDFLLDSVSGGLSSIIDIAWQIYTYSHERNEFTTIIDEPENHLHPSMQRALLPNLLTAFPKVQFIVATHSPFVVTAVKDSSVHVLTYGDETRDRELAAVAPPSSVHSTKLDQINKAGTANEILRNVLGLDSTMPLWASDELESIVQRYRQSIFDGNKVAELHKELTDLGLADSLPFAVDSIIERTGQQ